MARKWKKKHDECLRTCGTWKEDRRRERKCSEVDGQKRKWDDAARRCKSCPLVKKKKGASGVDMMRRAAQPGVARSTADEPRGGARRPHGGGSRRGSSRDTG